MKLTLTVQGISDVKKALDKAGAITRFAMVNHVGVTAFGIQKTAKEKVAVDVGRTRAGIQVTFYREGLSAEVYVNPESGVYLEEGTGPAVGRPPFMPPSSALRGWAARHGMAGKEFLIARAIGRRGQKPRPFFRPAVEEHSKNYSDEAARLLRFQLDKGF